MESRIAGNHSWPKPSLQFDATIHSSDAIREELLGDINCQDNNNAVFKELHKRVMSDLMANKNVIYDATNIRRSTRKKVLNRIKKNAANCTCICYHMDTPLPLCFARKKRRERKVPDAVIRRMYYSLEQPTKDEGWDELHIIQQI